MQRTAQEVPLCHGDIDWLSFAGLLETIDYRDWLTVQRDSGSSRREDIAASIGFLRRIVG